MAYDVSITEFDRKNTDEMSIIVYHNYKRGDKWINLLLYIRKLVQAHSLIFAPLPNE